MMPKKQKNNSKLTESQKLIDYILSKGITTVVVNTGEKDEEKKFLGYEFSTRKNQEGIHEYEEGSMLYSKNSNGSVDLNDDSNKVNYYIRQSFMGKCADEIEVSDCLEANLRITTQENLFDFGRGNRINVNPKLKFESEYDLIYLSKLITLERGVTYDKKDISRTGNGNIVLSVGSIDQDNIRLNLNGECVEKELDEKKKLKIGDIFLALSGSLKPSIGKVIYISENIPCYAGGFMGIIRPLPNSNCKQEYLAYLIGSSKGINILRSYCADKTSTMSNLSEEDIYNTRVPVPPMYVQDSIISECNIVDLEVRNAIHKIENYKEEINTIINGIVGEKALLGDNSRFEIGIGRRMLSKDVKGIGNIPVYSANVRKPFGYTDSLLDSFNNFDCDTAVWSIDNDWDTNYFPANYKFRPTDHTGYIRVKDNSIHPYLVSKLLYNVGVPCHFSRDYRASVEKIMELSIIIPEKSIQEKVVTECLDIEKKIIDAQTIINTARQRKDAILDKYLK